jgi:hypothetical protein
MTNKTIPVSAIIILSLVGNFYFGFKYFEARADFKETKSYLETQIANEKILEFAAYFIEKVLKADSEVDFETRLKLENMVRSIGDDEILALWNGFVGAKTELEAQDGVRNLLEALVSKIIVR